MSDECDFPWHPTDPLGEGKEEAGECNSGVLFSCIVCSKTQYIFNQEIDCGFPFPWWSSWSIKHKTEKRNIIYFTSLKHILMI